MATARNVGEELELLRAVERTNERQRKVLLARAVKHYGELSGRTFGVWGLSFKPKTDDMREAPSIELIEGLLGKGAHVRCHDPVMQPVARRHFQERILYMRTPYEAAEGARARRTRLPQPHVVMSTYLLLA